MYVCVCVCVCARAHVYVCVCELLKNSFSHVTHFLPLGVEIPWCRPQPLKAMGYTWLFQLKGRSHCHFISLYRLIKIECLFGKLLLVSFLRMWLWAQSDKIWNTTPPTKKKKTKKKHPSTLHEFYSLSGDNHWTIIYKSALGKFRL